jgi:hypothetical protein
MRGGRPLACVLLWLSGPPVKIVVGGNIDMPVVINIMVPKVRTSILCPSAGARSTSSSLRRVVALLRPDCAQHRLWIGHICSMHALPQKRAAWHFTYRFSPWVVISNYFFADVRYAGEACENAYARRDPCFSNSRSKLVKKNRC